MERMTREQFFAAVAPLDRDELRRVLWQAYWRGGAPARARIEAELRPGDAGPIARDARPTVDPDAVLAQVAHFAELARSGAYLARSREVSPRQRTRWRFTYRELVADARTALGTDPITAGSEAMSTLIDLACETHRVDYFRSEDPVAAARLVVSDEVELLWSRTRHTAGFQGFARTASEQLIRWETPFGWTRRGEGPVAAKERPLADVVAGLLPAPDAWVVFAEYYVDALDRLLGARTRGQRSRPGGERGRSARAESLARWHELLVDRLVDTEGEPLLDRLAAHQALGGPELTFVQARLAHRRGDADQAARLVRDALRALPGHPEFLALARTLRASAPSADGGG